jgi:hypothetical protein
VSDAPTYEEAIKCPACEMTGIKVNEQALPARPGAKLHVYSCVTEGCRNNGLNYFIQVNPDGSIPPPQIHRADSKLYPKEKAGRTSTEQEQREKAFIDRMQREVEMTMKPGTEVKNPYGR